MTFDAKGRSRNDAIVLNFAIFYLDTNIVNNLQNDNKLT